MKNRRIPFGYSMEQGHIEIRSDEADTIRWLYAQYRAGASLTVLASALTDKRAEYLPGEYVWNKCRVKRILEDARYYEGMGFPPIVSKEEYLAVQRLREEKRESVDRTPCGGLRDFQRKVICEGCGQPMQHLYEKRNRSGRMRWRCIGCDAVVKMDDKTLLGTVTALLNALASEPERIVSKKSELRPDTSYIDIRRMLNSDFDKEQMKEMILAYAAERYMEIDNTRHLSEVVRAELRNVVPLSTFSEELVEKVVSHVRLKAGGDITLELINGQIIGKEDFIHDVTATCAG